LVSPCEFVRVGGLRIMRDSTVRREPRRQEIVVCGLTPSEALIQIRKYKPPAHFVCVILPEVDDSVKEAYKSAGYRLNGSEDFFVRQVRREIDPVTGSVLRVRTVDEAEKVARAAGRRQILPEHLDGTQVRLYAAFEGDQVVGWVRSIHLEPKTAWVSNLGVKPEFRRRGHGRALMSALLAEDREHGVEWSVLLASRVGAMLYPQLGYERIGVLLAFSPVR
jgi:ribosomal protein S18 acetylase RimI-like enzyme